MFPATQNKVKEVAFDEDWMTAICSAVYMMTGMKPQEVMHFIPISTAFLFYIQCARFNGQKHIQKRTSVEIAKAMDVRCNELITDRLIELKKLPACKRDEFIAKIAMPQQQ